jgi:DNA-binding sugar fermentation-stimulating protein
MKLLASFMILALLTVSCSTSKNKKDGKLQNLQSKMIHLDVQLIQVNSLISNAEARKELNQPTEEELTDYQNQKQEILAQKSMLQSQLRIIR